MCSLSDCGSRARADVTDGPWLGESTSSARNLRRIHEPDPPPALRQQPRPRRRHLRRAIRVRVAARRRSAALPAVGPAEAAACLCSGTMFPLHGVSPLWSCTGRKATRNYCICQQYCVTRWPGRWTPVTERRPFQCRCGLAWICAAQQRNIALFHLFLRARRGPAHRTAVVHVPGRPPPHERAMFGAGRLAFESGDVQSSWVRGTRHRHRHDREAPNEKGDVLSVSSAIGNCSFATRRPPCDIETDPPPDRWHCGWRGCPRFVHGAGPRCRRGAVGKGWTTPWTTLAMASGRS